MTDRNKRSGSSLTLPPRPADYDVGYGKPPVASRFQPGRSGNPRGRKRGTAHNAIPALNDERLKTLILEETYRTISINDQNGQLDIPMAQAVVRSLAVNAAKGNQRAQRLFTQLLSSVERDNKRLHDEWFNTALDYKLAWERELERRATFKINAPLPIPHPDDIVVDLQAGTIRVTGPMTKEEKVKWDRAAEHREKAIEAAEELKAILEADPDHPDREELKACIKYVDETFQKVDRQRTKLSGNKTFAKIK